MSLFRSREAADIETVRGKLEQARIAVRNAQGDLDDLALSAILSSDPAFAAEAAARLRLAKEHEALCEKALQVAEAKEAQRIALARADLRAVQNRAIRQHLTALFKDGTAYQAAVDNQVSAFRRMVKSGEAVRKLLPRDFDRSGFEDLVSPHALKQYCALYAAKWAARPGVGNEDPALDPPGFSPRPAPLPSGVTYPQELPSLVERLKDQLLKQFDRLTGRNAPPAPSEELEAIEPTPKPLPAPAAAPLPITSEMVEMHGKGAFLQSAVNELLGV